MCYPPPAVLSDLLFWLTALQCDDVSRMLSPRSEVQDLGIYVDASTSWGIGPSGKRGLISVRFRKMA